MPKVVKEIGEEKHKNSPALIEDLIPVHIQELD